MKLEFKLDIHETKSLFPDSQACKISDYLTQTLKRNLPLAVAINTEKARSELLVMNILLEVKEQLKNTVSVFSGIDFTVDKERGLSGFCDFIVSQSPEQLYLETPVLTIVEAKNEHIVAGLGQCLAEMYAAALYNENEGHQLPHVYGAVTTGDEWKFTKLEGKKAFIDIDSYYASDIEKIVGILVEMMQSKH